MINHKHKCIFIHIPKTAGKSIELALGADLRKLHRSRTHIKHGTPLEWRYPKHWEKYFTFTFVRNPWDRFVSAYFCDWGMLRRNPLPRRRIIARLGSVGFKDFVKHHSDHYEWSRFYKSQMDWIVSNYDFIGRFENLQEDFNVVCDKIGIPQQELPHKNKTNHKHYTEYYDDETREIIANWSAGEIEMFGYEFGG